MSFYETDGARVRHHLEALEAAEALRQRRRADRERRRLDVLEQARHHVILVRVNP